MKLRRSGIIVARPRERRDFPHRVNESSPDGVTQIAGAASAAATVLSLSKGVIGSIDGGRRMPLATSAVV